MPTLTDDLHDWLGQCHRRIETLTLEPELEPIGQVVQVGDGVATVRGLPETRLDELLIFEGGVRGLAVDLGEAEIGCVLLGETSGIPVGQCRARHWRGRARAGRRRLAGPRCRCAGRAA